MRSGRRHLAPVGGNVTLCGRKGTFEPASDHAGPSCAICGMAAEGRSRKGRKTAIVFHAFRHTCASLLFAENRNFKQVAAWLGHADRAFTLRVYVDLLDEGMGGGLELSLTPTGRPMVPMPAESGLASPSMAKESVTSTWRYGRESGPERPRQFLRRGFELRVRA